jgi:hypothetical protein
MYWLAMEINGKPRLTRFLTLGMLLILGMGISLNNSLAVMEALFGIRSSFLRTPKFNIHGDSTSLKKVDYQVPINWMTTLEILLALYALIILVLSFYLGAWRFVFWLPLYIAGFSYVAGLALYQSIQSRSSQYQTSSTGTSFHKQVYSPSQVQENPAESMPGD